MIGGCCRVASDTKALADFKSLKLNLGFDDASRYCDRVFTSRRIPTQLVYGGWDEMAIDQISHLKAEFATAKLGHGTFFSYVGLGAQLGYRLQPRLAGYSSRQAVDAVALGYVSQGSSSGDCDRGVQCF